MEKPEIILLNIIGVQQLGDSQVKLISDSCSGVAISDQLVLTAGHCISVLNGQKTVGVYYNTFLNGDLKQIAAVKSFTEYVYEEYPDDDTSGPVPGCSAHAKPIVYSKTTDLALVKFPPKTFDSCSVLDFQTRLQVGDSFDYYGFGIHYDSRVQSIPSGPASQKDLREGSNTVWRMNDQRIAFVAEPTKAFADHGDSGGPLYKDDKVVAMISTNGIRCETEYGDDYAILNTAVVLSSVEAQAFFQKAFEVMK